MLEAFSKAGAAFVRPVQVLPTAEEITAELTARAAVDERKRIIRHNLLADIFPDKYQKDYTVTEEELQDFLDEQGLPFEAFVL